MKKEDYIRQYYAALKLAIRAHDRQLDKGNMPYIIHPIRVSERCKTPEAKIAALLHDTLEDSVLTVENLTRSGISSEIAGSVYLLTHQKHDTYEEYIKNLSSNKIAVEVKLADLEDNMDIARLLGPLDEKDFQRLQKYKAAYDYLRYVEH